MKPTEAVHSKIMITGTRGFVGARALSKYPNAIAVPSELTRAVGTELSELVCKHKPDIILNCAAISDIGTCEKNPDASYTANVLLPVTLARAASAIGAKLISFSSDQVYTGCQDEGPYSESEPLPAPANIYARHKLEAEARVLDIAPSSVLLRATWMYDMPMYKHVNRANFLTNIYNALMRRERMGYSVRDYRGITYVRQAVELLDKVFSLSGGVYNYGSENDLNMYETALACARTLGYEELAKELIFKTYTHRHNLWMNCSKLKACNVCFDTTEQGFARLALDYRILC